MCSICCLQIFITGYTSWISKNIVLHSCTLIISGVAEMVHGICEGESCYTGKS